MRNRSSETGSIIFYILIAVMLFAALGIAVSKINQGTPASNQTIQLQASEVLQFANGLRTAVQTMQVSGVTDTQISFDNPLLSGVYTNAGCTAESCKLFSPAGGALSYARAESAWLDAAQSGGTAFGDWVFSGNNAVSGVGTDGNGDASADLLAILPWVNKALCNQINAMLNIVTPTGNPPQDDAAADLADKFTGTYTGTIVIGGGNTQIPHQRAGCFQDSGPAATAPYHFYEVLLAR